VHYLLASPLRALLEPPRTLVGALVAPGMTVLDPGCGFGHLSLPMARMVGPSGRILSVDVEPRAVSRLVARARKAGLAERIEARVCGPRDLCLGDYRGRVDLATVIHTLHEIEDLQGFVRQVGELLKPEGRMLVVEPKSHVSPRQLELRLERFRRAGFGALAPPPLGGRRLVALLSAPH
jgi:cyclopropane fatty-acyl-phospholipid synthase-like methyltransferase